MNGKAAQRIKYYIMAAVLGLCLTLAGCGRRAVKERGSFKIVTSFYPMYIMMLNLADGADGVEVVNMASPQTGCLHDYQLRPGDLVCLEGADLFLMNGCQMESFLDDVLDAHPGLDMICATDALPAELFLTGEGYESEGWEEEGHDEGHGTVGKDVVENPHTWMDPILYEKEAAYIGKILEEKDPAHAEKYKENREAYLQKIRRLRKEFDELKDSYKGEECILLHESFAYMMDSLDVPVAGVIEVEKDSGFSAKELKHMIDKAGEVTDGIIVSDQQYSGRTAEILAEETGFAAVQLDSCVSGEYDKDAYINSMRNNLEEWKKCVN